MRLVGSIFGPSLPTLGGRWRCCLPIVRHILGATQHLVGLGLDLLDDLSARARRFEQGVGRSDHRAGDETPKE
ncbi:MAG: hypothetical protein V9H69_27465 [Anaerolineae bacterium]